MNKLTASLDFESPDNTVLLEVAAEKEPVLFGSWTFHVRLGNKVLLPDGAWTEICVHKEKGCIYREIDLPLSGGYRLQRCLLVNSKDNVLLLADAVIGGEKPQSRRQEIFYCSELYPSPRFQAKSPPDAAEIDFYPLEKNAGHAAVRPFRVLPIGLPEWKSADVPGSCIVEDGKLVLRQKTSGRSLFAPLLFDLDSGRMKKKYTWRSLTVGENMQKVPEDQAVGYRVQLHQDQFLLYRSLTTPGNRTVLGHNLTDDFCFARFSPETGAEPLIAVEITE
ncbi:MAG: hypothetical protein LBH00_00755 [Planctomycetaceae bacterium]|jgi:hypothetical protein|nr:hypothetical protein [Planctomycetaceae bacterium]